jgi:TATA-binding protein-associated factor
MSGSVNPSSQTAMARRRIAKLVCHLAVYGRVVTIKLTFPIAALALEALHKQVLPFLLRRLKEDVLHDLPPKIIQDYYCELSDLQKYLYDDFSRSQARFSAEEDIQSANLGKESKQQHVFQSLQYLRKICNHPALVLKHNTAAISAAMSQVGSKSDDLSDIQHAPKLLALRCAVPDCVSGELLTHFPS